MYITKYYPVVKVSGALATHINVDKVSKTSKSQKRAYSMIPAIDLKTCQTSFCVSRRHT